MEIWKFLGDLPWDLGPSGLQPAPSGDHLHPAILFGVSDPGYLLSLRGLHGQGVWDGEGQHTDIPVGPGSATGGAGPPPVHP